MVKKYCKKIDVLIYKNDSIYFYIYMNIEFYFNCKVCECILYVGGS